MLMTRENLNSYQGQINVTNITDDAGSVSYLTQSVSFGDEAYATGACKLNTIENEKKHVLFLFNGADAEVGRYYLGKKLQGKTPAELVEMKHTLCFFKSWNPATESWVPCVGQASQEDLSKSAVAF
jgi:hypothetical protein